MDPQNPCPRPFPPPTPPTGSETSSPSPRGLWFDIWQRFRHDRTALLGAITLALITIAVSLGPIAYPASPSEIDFARSE
ncbi:MAG: hypothetical protein HC795_18430, partial [Coleofasciculaceae cyanobacterium RL_1_1]|nr:hypothetical protein [Coleofasciculaceae cyanobacterium RL_1_1]